MFPRTSSTNRPTGLWAFFFIFLSFFIVTRAEQEVELVNIQFSALSLGQTLRDLRVEDSTGVHTLTIPNAARSKDISYTGSPQLTLFRFKEGESGENRQIPLATIDMSGQQGQWLLILIPDGDRFRIFPMQDSVAEFPWNSWRVFNLGPYPMAFEANADNLEVIQPGNHFTFNSSQSENSTDKVQVAIRREKDWDLVYRSLWGRRTNARSLIFLVPREGGDRILVRRFSQTRREDPNP